MRLRIAGIAVALISSGCATPDDVKKTGVVWHGHQLINAVAWPVFLQHLFLGDENNVTAQPFTFANKVAALEVGGQANDIERMWLGRRHEISGKRLDLGGGKYNLLT